MNATTPAVLAQTDVEATLRRTQTQLEQALSVGLIATWYWDLTTDLVYADGNLSVLFGIDPEQGKRGLSIETFLRAVHPDDQERVRSVIDEAIVGENAYEAEFRIGSAPGSIRWVLARGRTEFEAGRPVRFPGVLIDITDRKMAQLQAQESEERLKLAVEAADLGTWDYNPLTNQLTWSDRYRALVGLPPTAAVTYELFLQTLHPQDRAAVDQAVQQTLQPGGPATFQVEYRLVDFAEGRLRWLRANGRTFRNAAGQAERFIGTVIDITDSRQINQGLEQRVIERTMALEEAQRQVREMNHLLQGVMDASQSIITYCEAVRDDEGRITDFVYRLANEGVSRLVGAARERVIGQRMTHYFPSVKEIGLFAQYAEVVDSRQPATFEFAYQADDYDGWYLISATPLLDGFVLSFIDITDRKRTELRAQQAVRRLEEVVNGSLNGLLACEPVRDADGLIVDLRMTLANQSASAINGYSVGQLAGSTLLERFPGLQASDLMARYLHTARTGEVQRFEAPYTGEGMDGWYDIVLTPLSEGGTLISFLDVTDRKRAELAIQQQARQLQFVTDSALTAIGLYAIVRDETTGEVVDLRYELINQMAERMTGRKADELIGRTMRQVFPGIEASGLWLRYKELAETGTPIRYHNHYTHDGYDLWYEVQGVRGGEYIVLSFLDITELKQTQLQLESLNKELLRSNDHLQQFAYVASHDLQEPLRKIQAFGNLVREQYAPELGEQGADLLGRMESAASRMSALIKDLLSYSRITTHREPFQRLSLNEVVNEVLDDLQVAIREKQAVVDVGELPSLMGDRSQLHQLFQNLIGNALKFQPPGQTPVVSVSSRRLKPAEWPDELKATSRTGAPDDQTVPGRTVYEIRVNDNGIGFDTQHTERIFGVFQRLHGRQEYAGSGIGLSISRKVVQNHGGIIRAFSQLGEGATFLIYLPA